MNLKLIGGSILTYYGAILCTGRERDGLIVSSLIPVLDLTLLDSFLFSPI